MTPLRVAIVDDEAHARAALRVMLADRSDVTIAAECRNGEEAVEVLSWLPVDVLFLDVQMPGLDGFQVVHAMGAARMPSTVFVTAHDEYAMRAFDVEAIDYVLKPFDRTRLFAALDRAKRRIAERESADWARRLVDATRDRTPPPPVPRARLPVPNGDRIVFVPLDEIDWIEAADQYVTLHAGTRALLMRQSLQSLLARLPAGRFAQIHRSHAVNVAKVKEVVRLAKGDAEVVLTSRPEPLRLSRRYRDDLRKRFDWPL